MNYISEKYWIPVIVSTPDTPRNVQIQLKDYPDPTVGCFDRGKWTVLDKIIADTKSPVIAWREMARKYNPDCDTMKFRTAEETQMITLNAIKTRKSDTYDPEFFAIRETILHEATCGKWYAIIKSINENNMRELMNAGFNIRLEENIGYVVSWE